MRGMRPLDDAEAAAVAEAFGGPLAARNRMLFVWLYHLGWRISELLSLTLGDVLLPDGRPKRFVSVARRFRKRKTEGRTDPVTPAMTETLLVWLATLPARGLVPTDSLPLFCTSSGRCLRRQGAWEALAGAYERAGIGRTGVGCHGVRKTHGKKVHEYALARLREGESGENPMRVAQASLGHQSIESTEHYLEMDESAVQAARLSLPDPRSPGR